jgi:hypothetical protein
MGGVGPLDMAGAVKAVALILDGQPVEVLGLHGRHTYPHESTSAVVTVSVHLDDAEDVDHVGDLLGLGDDRALSDDNLYSLDGDWLPGVHLNLYGRSRLAAAAAEEES